MAQHRRERVSKGILHAIGSALQDTIKDPRLSTVTVVDVEVSPDLRVATVFYTVLGGQEAQEAAHMGLDSAHSFLRREVAQSLQLRFAPELRFVYDSSWERGAHIDSLLEQLERDGEG